MSLSRFTVELKRHVDFSQVKCLNFKLDVVIYIFGAGGTP